MTRLAALSDVHGNATALEAVLADIAREKPDAVLIAGDLVLNGPEPALVVDVLRSLADDGALIVAGNTDIAVADFDYAAAFPWMTDGVPDAIVDAAEWAHDALGAERVDWLRRLPAERRWRTDDDTLVLVCHASPGSQTAGFDQGLDPSVTIERVARTDARVIVCGHTHLPEVRDLGWKVIVNDGSAGYVFDGDPTASWALIDIADGEVHAEIRRTTFDTLGRRQRDLRPRPGRRRLPGRHGPHREARPMSPAPGPIDASSSPGWACSRRSATTWPSTWAGLVAGRSGVATIDAFDPSRLSARIAGRGPRLRRRAMSSTARTSAGRTATSSSASSPRARRWTRPACRSASRASSPSAPGCILGTGLGGVGTLDDGIATNALRGPDRISPFLIPMGIPNVGAGPDRHQLRDDRAELRHGLRLRDRRPRDRRGVRDHPARRRRRHAGRRLRGRHLRAAGRRVRVDARAVDPQRRPGSRLAAVRHGPRRVRVRRGRRRRSSSRSSSTREPAVRRRSPSSSATARRPTPRTSRCRHRAASARSGPPAGRSRRPG